MMESWQNALDLCWRLFGRVPVAVGREVPVTKQEEKEESTPSTEAKA